VGESGEGTQFHYIGSAVLCFVVIFLCHVSLLLPLRITDARSSLPRLLSSSHTFLSPSPGVLSLASSPLFLHRRPFFLRSLPTAKSEKALFSPFNIFFPSSGLNVFLPPSIPAKFLAPRFFFFLQKVRLPLFSASTLSPELLCSARSFSSGTHQIKRARAEEEKPPKKIEVGKRKI
jgi:hypothetical protein